MTRRDESIVELPRWVVDLLIEAAKHARYDMPADPDQVACIAAYEREHVPNV